MSGLTIPLKASIDEIRTKFGGVVGAPIPETTLTFKGVPLFCHASSVGGLLTLKVDEKGPGAGYVAVAATAADISLTVGKAPDVLLHLAGINVPGKVVISAIVRVTPDLKHAFLYIQDEQRVAQQDDVDLGFVLIQEQTAEQLYRVEWIEPAITIANDEQRSSASVVPIDPSQPAVIGPMGLSTP